MDWAGGCYWLDRYELEDPCKRGALIWITDRLLDSSFAGSTGTPLHTRTSQMPRSDSLQCRRGR
jgi:hypothetical protein